MPCADSERILSSRQCTLMCHVHSGVTNLRMPAFCACAPSGDVHWRETKLRACLLRMRVLQRVHWRETKLRPSSVRMRALLHLVQRRVTDVRPAYPVNTLTLNNVQRTSFLCLNYVTLVR